MTPERLTEIREWFSGDGMTTYQLMDSCEELLAHIEEGGGMMAHNSRKGPDCYACKFRTPVWHSAHSGCAHPETLSGNPEKKLGIMAVYHGIKNGWFDWPVNFDPVWLENCTGFTDKDKE